MSDRFHTSYTFGGKLQYGTVARLSEILAYEGFGLNWGDSDDTATHKTFLQRRHSGAHQVTHGELSGGESSALEAFLTDQGLSWLKRTDGRYEIDGEIKYWLPGMKRPVTRRADSDANNMVVTRADLENYLRSGMTQVQSIIELLQEPAIPNLELV